MKRTVLALALGSLLLVGCNDVDEPTYNYVPSSSVSSSSNNSSPVEETKPKLSLSQQNAIRSAKSYLKALGFSRVELIEQLEYEGYTYEEAVYAVDSLEVDWNEECAESAKSYLNALPFSRKELKEQLEYEGFTDEQVAYGLQAVGY